MERVASTGTRATRSNSPSLTLTQRAPGGIGWTRDMHCRRHAEPTHGTAATVCLPSALFASVASEHGQSRQ